MNNTEGWPDGVVPIDRRLRFGDDGELWTGNADPRGREVLLGVYRKLCESGAEGRQLVAVHQELLGELDALFASRTSRQTLRDRAGRLADGRSTPEG